MISLSLSLFLSLSFSLLVDTFHLFQRYWFLYTFVQVFDEVWRTPFPLASTWALLGRCSIQGHSFQSADMSRCWDGDQGWFWAYHVTMCIKRKTSCPLGSLLPVIHCIIHCIIHYNPFSSMISFIDYHFLLSFIHSQFHYWQWHHHTYYFHPWFMSIPCCHSFAAGPIEL